jgi:MarR family 2-MHQ and catechol resistance regulon transcriptional repressor
MATHYGQKAALSMKTWMQVFRTYNKIRAKELAYIQSYDLTMPQFQVLEVLYHKGDLNIGSITKLTMSTPGNITVVVKNLKRDGLIVSLQDENDKRASILTITQKGKAIIEKVFPQHAKNFETYFNVLNNEELETLYTLLNKLQKSQ